MTTPQQINPGNTIIEVREIQYDPMRKEDFNQNNIRELTPFRAYNRNPTNSTACNDDFPVLYILEEFWDKLRRMPSAINHIHTYYSKDAIIIISDANDFSDGGDDETGYWVVYRAWCQMYNADKWFQVFGNLAELIPLTPYEKKLLYGEKSITYTMTESLAFNILLQELDSNIQQLQKASGQQEVFIKTSAKSTKHDIPVQPITNAREALEYLLPSPTIQGVLARDEPVELFIRPWQPEVNNDNEIRVFIQDGQIKAVSQQYLYSSSPVLGMIFRYSAADILDQIREWWAQPEVQQLAYQDAVLDMYITGEGQVELIEINCGGNGWGPAGSSLFTWSEINSIPEGKCVFAYY